MLRLPDQEISGRQTVLTFAAGACCVNNKIRSEHSQNRGRIFRRRRCSASSVWRVRFVWNVSLAACTPTILFRHEPHREVLAFRPAVIGGFFVGPISVRSPVVKTPLRDAREVA